MKENTYVRTAADLERKYNLVGIQQAVKLTETELVKTNGELENFANSITNIQEQIDGKIETWYGNGVPTLENEPASTWEEYESHISDVYFDKDTGIAYRFIGTGWEETGDTSLSQALSIANSAKDTADNKRRVFVAEPIPPYDTGDLWLNNQELYICQIAKIENEQFESTDFIKATNYVTDSVIIGLEDSLRYIDERIGTVEASTSEIKLDFETTRRTADESKQVIDKWNKQITIDGDIALSASNSDYSLKIENDGIGIYKGTTKISHWEQDTFEVRQLILGNFAFIPRENGSLGFRKVK